MLLDLNTGEIIKDKYAQLYFKDLKKLFSLTTKQTQLLFLMARQIGLGNSGSINMTPKRKKEFAKELGVSTTNSISNMLRALERADVAKRLDPEEYPNRYTLNPEIIFSGNEYQRAKILIEYSDGERRVKAFPNEEALKKYLMKGNTK